MVKFFNEKCVRCFERDSDFAFRFCGHQCIGESCQNKGDIGLVKSIVCTT